MGGEWHHQSSTGPENLRSLWRKQQSTHPLEEEINIWFLCLNLIKEPWNEIPFICLENHWLIHKVFNRVVSTTRQWWSGTGISDCFSRHESWIPLISRWSWDSFSSLKYLSYHRAQNCKKGIETIKHDQHWIFNSVSFDVSAKAFPYFNIFERRGCCPTVRRNNTSF